MSRVTRFAREVIWNPAPCVCGLVADVAGSRNERGAVSSLAGKRVLVTRASKQASELVDRLRAEGAIVILIPTIEIVEPKLFDGLDAALTAMQQYDLVLFTSANAVRTFGERARLLGIEIEPKRIGVVGPATARAVEEIGLRVDVMPPKFLAESLAEVLLPEANGLRVLLVRAEVAPDLLPEALKSAGALVTIAAAYANRIPEGSVAAMRELFGGDGAPDAITFTSASTATNLIAVLEAAGLRLPEESVRASIGPVTSRTLREIGFPAHVEAAEAGIESLVEALQRRFSGIYPPPVSGS